MDGWMDGCARTYFDSPGIPSQRFTTIGFETVVALIDRTTRMTRWTKRLNKHALASAFLVSWAVALQFHVWHVKQSLESQREDDFRHQGTGDGHVQP